MHSPVAEVVFADVRAALAEDVGRGDLSAPLVAEDAKAQGVLICRAPTVLCGRDWFEECFRALDARVGFAWGFHEGDEVPGDAGVGSGGAGVGSGGVGVCVVRGSARALLAGERSGINFLQTLSATASAARAMQHAAGDKVVVVDTRKTIPKLRAAQKYAVRVGGARNHRAGLFDEILVKENHIAVAGGVARATRAALALLPKEKIQVEVRNLQEMREAISAGAGRVLLDNFSLSELREAVLECGGRAELEASGGADLENIAAVAATGVDRISSGAMTKNVRAADFSLTIAADDAD